MEQRRTKLVEELTNPKTQLQQHTPQQPVLREAMDDVANTVEYILEKKAK